MSGQERREQIVNIIKSSEKPVAGTELAKRLGVSRQIIVQDMALIRANGIEVMSTNRGYIIQETKVASRVFKVIHTDEQVEEEASVGGVLATLRLIGDDKNALLLLDKDLATRTFTAPVIG